jgi:hypothetical protein
MTQQLATCPKCGQASSEADFCSECGARIGGASAVASSVGSAVVGVASAVGPDPAAVPTAVDGCPECHTPRPTPDGRFCEVCRYDFLKQTAGAPPVATPVAPVASAPPAEPPQDVPTPNGVTWDVVIAVDPSLDTDPDPELTAPDDPERRIPLDRAENLIGRRDAKQSIVPDVRPNDPSVSRRHAKLLINADGTMAILDLDSANGTFVNGEQILGGVPRTLTTGDVVTIGRWTRLRIEPRGLP